MTCLPFSYNHPEHRAPRSRQGGFTIVELMASTALLIGLMVLLITTLDQAQRVWRRSSEKATQFQGARSAFDSMTRRLSQATLNTYWRAFDTDIDAALSNFRFRRQSELQFLSGPSSRIFGASPAPADLSQPIPSAYPTHSIFFQAPLGYTEEMETGSGGDRARFRTMDSLLVGCGYFIEYGPQSDMPEFLSKVPGISDRFRFRLMEMTVPAERLNIFKRPNDTAGFNDPRVFDEQNQYPYKGLLDKNRVPQTDWVRPLWMKDALMRVPNNGDTPGSHFRFARPRAENVIALIVLPKLAEKDRATVDKLELAPYYEYDSWRILVQGVAQVRDGNRMVKVDNVARENLLPPIVQVTMVAVDEPSMNRLNLQQDNVPEWTKDLFTRAEEEIDYEEDMRELENRLQKAGLNYRIFTTDVVIRSSKWSREPVFPQLDQ